MIEKEFSKFYDKKFVWWVFTLVFISNVLINVDHGTLPGCSIEIQNSLGMDYAEFGTLGSIVYAGLVPGSIVATIVFEKSHYIKGIMFSTLAL